MRPFLTMSLAALALAIGAVARLPAQTVGGGWEVEHRIEGRANDSRVGLAIAAIGDVDGDGRRDLAVHHFAEGLVSVYSAWTGTHLYSIRPGGIALVRLDDVNHDGFDDLAIGDRGRVDIHSGRDGAKIRRYTGRRSYSGFGSVLAYAGDVDGDGMGDLIVGGSIRISDHEPVVVYSGATGAILHTFHREVTSFKHFGGAVAGADVDADGHADILISDHNAPVWSGRGMVYVYSGADGRLLHEIEGPPKQLGLPIESGFGTSLANAGDLDRDGHDDFLVGAPWACWRTSGRYSGSVYAVSGATASILWRVDGTHPGEDFGQAIAGAGDASGDGVPDPIVGSAQYDAGSGRVGRVLIVSGTDGSVLREIPGPLQGSTFGYRVDSFGDLDGDQMDDYLIGAPYSNSGGFYENGAVFILAGFRPLLTATSDRLSSSAGGSVEFLLDFPDADGGLPYRLLGSSRGIGPSTVGGIVLPLTIQGRLWEETSSRLPPVGFTNATGTLDAAGDATVTLTLPPGAAARYVGRTLAFAAATFASPTAGIRSSVAVPLTIDP